MADSNGSPQGSIGWPEIKTALLASAEWFIGGFAGTFGIGLMQNPRPDFKSLAENAAVVAASGFLLRVARIFGSNTLNGNGGAK